MSTLTPVNEAIAGLRLDCWLNTYTHMHTHIHLNSATGSLLQKIMAPKLKTVSTLIKKSEDTKHAGKILTKHNIKRENEGMVCRVDLRWRRTPEELAGLATLQVGTAELLQQQHPLSALLSQLVTW